MADLSFYKYLEAAFRYKLYKNPQATSFGYLGYNLPYETKGATKGLFGYARKILPEFYTSKFPDTEEGHLQMAKKVLEQLDRKQDYKLTQHFEGFNIAQDQQVIEEAGIQSEAAEQVNAGEPTATMTGEGFTPSVPSGSSVRSGPQTQNLPKGGKEGGTGEGTAVSQKAARLAAKQEVPAVKIPYSFKNAAKNFGTFLGTNFKRFATPQRLVTGFTTILGGITGMGIAGSPGAFGGAILGAIAPAAIKANGGKWIGNLANGAANTVSNLTNRIPSLHLSGGGSAGSFVGKSAKGGRIALLAFGAVFVIAFVLGMAGALMPTSNTPVVSANPLTAFGAADISICKFTRDGNPQLIKSSILAGWISDAAATAGIPPQVLASVAMHESQSFVANADNNHDAIKTNNYCSPGIKFCEKNGQVLHSISGRDDPCTPDEIADGAKTAQALGLMQTLDIYNPGKDLCKITESLSIAANKLKNDGITAQPSQDQVNTAVERYYNSCNYGNYSYCDEVWKDTQNCSVATAAIASCPVAGGTISTPSFDADPARGHCGGGYAYSCNCGTSGRRAKAIDVLTRGQNAVLPQINNQSVDWRLVVGPYSVDSNEGGGFGYTFQATRGNDKWYLDMLHLNRTNLTTGVDYSSGTAVANSAITHVHMTIGKNLSNSPVAGTATDCDPNWLPSDFMCK